MKRRKPVLLVSVVLLSLALVLAGCKSAALGGGNKPGADTNEHVNDSVSGNHENAGGNEKINGNPGNRSRENPDGPLNESDLDPDPQDNGGVIAKKRVIVLYYSDNELMNMYRVKREISAGKEEDLPRAALEAWIAGPGRDDLSSLIPPQTVVESVEIRDNIAYVSFSAELKNANVGSTGEAFIFEQIALIMKQFGAEATQILIEGKAADTLFGHMTSDTPYIPGDPEQYEWLE